MYAIRSYYGVARTRGYHLLARFHGHAYYSLAPGDREHLYILVVHYDLARVHIWFFRRAYQRLRPARGHETEKVRRLPVAG